MENIATESPQRIENLHIAASSSTFFVPEVDFNAQTGKCRIEGESYLEDTFQFYSRLSEWIQDYFAHGNEQLNLDFKLKYFNTSSSRAILDLLKKLKEYEEAGKSVTVTWFFPDPDDDEMEMEGEDFKIDSGLNIQFKEYELIED